MFQSDRNESFLIAKLGTETLSVCGVAGYLTKTICVML